METVGERLRWARQRHVWSQVNLSRFSGVPVMTISRIENNRHGLPKLSTVRRLAEALEIDPTWLIYGSVHFPRPDSSEKTNAKGNGILESA